MSSRGPLAGAVLAHARPLGEEHRDASLRRLRHAFDQRPVDLLGVARAENRAELGGDLARLGDQQHARRVAVEPMRQHRPLALLVAQRLEHAVDMPLGARAALHRQAEGLVQHHQVAVLEQDHGADRLGVARIGRSAVRRRRAGFAERRHAHALAGLEPGRNLGPLARDPHFALADDLVEMRLRDFRESPAEPTVEAHARLVLADRVGGDAARARHVRLRINARPAHSPSAPSSTEPTT